MSIIFYYSQRNLSLARKLQVNGKFIAPLQTNKHHNIVQSYKQQNNELLSNDPGKRGSSFFCYATIRFPHIGMFSFIHIECINLQKGSLQNKMYL